MTENDETTPASEVEPDDNDNQNEGNDGEPEADE